MWDDQKMWDDALAPKQTICSHTQENKVFYFSKPMKKFLKNEKKNSRETLTIYETNFKFVVGFQHYSSLHFPASLVCVPYP